MRIQWKLMLLVVLVLIGTLTAVIWKTRALLVSDKTSFMADSAMKQMAPLKRLVRDRLEEQKAILVKLASNHQPTSQGRQLGRFDIISLMQAPDGNQWAPSWVEHGIPTPIANATPGKPLMLTSDYEMTLLKSLPFAKLKDGDTVWTRVSDQQGLPVYAIMMSVEIQNSGPGAQMAAVSAASSLPDNVEYGQAFNPAGLRRAVLIGLSSSNVLTDVTEEYIGSVNAVYLVDDKGYVASHVSKAYVGTHFKEDPITRELLGSRRTGVSGRYDDLEGRPVLGHFERIDHTNLTAVITTPMQIVNDLSRSYTKTAWLVGGMGCLFAAFAAWLLGRSMASPIKDLMRAVEAMKKGEAFLLRPSESGDEIGQLMRLMAENSTAAAITASAEKAARATPGKAETDGKESVTSGPASTSASNLASSIPRPLSMAMTGTPTNSELNSSMVSALKEPLMSILGHAQLARTKADGPEVRSHTESIERDVRRAKDLLERLGSFVATGTQTSPDEFVDLYKVITEILDSKRAVVKTDGLELVLELNHVPLVKGSSEQLRSAVSNIIDNAREATRKRPRKSLKVELSFGNEQIVVRFTDSGVGLSRDVKERAFEPLFKAFESPERAGLGLAVVQRAVELSKGSAAIDGIPGDGASVTLKFPVDSEQKRIFLTHEVAIATEPLSAVIDVADAIDLSSRSMVTSTRSEPGKRFQDTDTMLGDFDLSSLDGDAEAFASVSLHSPAMADTTVSEVSELKDLGDGTGPDSNPGRPISSSPKEAAAASPAKDGVDDEFRVQVRRPRARS